MTYAWFGSSSRLLHCPLGAVCNAQQLYRELGKATCQYSGLPSTLLHLWHTPDRRQRSFVPASALTIVWYVQGAAHIALLEGAREGLSSASLTLLIDGL